MQNYTLLSNVIDDVYRSAINSQVTMNAPVAPGQPSTWANIRDGFIYAAQRADEAVSNNVNRVNQTVSLFQYAKSTIISSRMFIEETLATEAILPNFTRNVLNLYVGMVITALNLDKFARDGRKIREVMEIVSTEGFEPDVAKLGIDLDQVVADYFLPTGSRRHVSEAVLADYAFGAMEAVVQAPPVTPQPTPANTTTTPPAPKPTLNDYTETSISKQSTANRDMKTINPVAKDVQLPCQAIIQLDLETSEITKKIDVEKGGRKMIPAGAHQHVSSTTSQSSRVNILVQLRPTFIPSTVSRAFVDMNFVPSRHQRWLQVKAGEIQFWKDFLMGCDVDKRYRKAMLDDKTGVLKEMFKAQANSLSRHYEKIATNSPVGSIMSGMKSSANIANTILVFDRKSFDMACSNAGVNFTIAATRRRFFEKTYAMIVAIIDSNYNRITMYYNGIDEGSEFTYAQINTNAKSDNADLVSIMKSYAANMAPKF